MASDQQSDEVHDEAEIPCRVLRVLRTDDGFEVVGDTFLAPDAVPVRWHVASFPVAGRDPSVVEAEANAAAASVARRIPTWFQGSAFFIDSSGRVAHIHGEERRGDDALS